MYLKYKHNKSKLYNKKVSLVNMYICILFIEMAIDYWWSFVIYDNE